MLTPAARATVVVVFFAAMRHAAAEAPKPLPGSVGLVQKQVELKNACVKDFRVIKKVKRGDDAAFVAAMTYPRISGLEFDPAKKARVEASRKKFDAWLKGLQAKFGDARKLQEQVAFADGAAPQARVEAIARMAILLEQAASLVESVEVPASLRKHPEALDVFCDQMLSVAEPMRAQVNDARAACAKAADEAKLAPGWWNEVCVVPTDAGAAGGAAAGH